jgi:hypothetical protein
MKEDGLNFRGLLIFSALLASLALSACAAPSPRGRVVLKSCVDCHAKEFEGYKQGRLHKPVAEKNCEGCHLPHGLLGSLTG